MISQVFYDHNGEEEVWTIGDWLVTSSIRGEVTRIVLSIDGWSGVDIWVGNNVAISIPTHKVNRVHWMKMNEE